jgi:acyl-CoA reductase-like NAD-dependent aldehyde dehydrogenase
MQVATSPQETHTELFIAGERRESAEEFPVFEPADPETIVGHAAAASAEQAREAVRAAHQAFPGWAELGPERRSELVRASLESLVEDEAERVELLSRENGKVRSECEIEMQALAGRFELAVGLAGELDPVRTLEPPPARTTVTRLPLGVVSIIVPFNWPLAIMGASLPYALVAGNTAVIKAPPTTPLAFMRTFERIAGTLPPGVLNVISGRDEEIGPVMIQDPLVRQVTFTGSVPAGKRIMSMAAENLTRVTLELGGNDPALVLSDAELDAGAFQRMFIGAFLTTGQVCMAMKRLYVHRSRYDEVVDGLSEVLAPTRLGRGLDPDATMGPLHTRRQRDFVADLLSDARRREAEVRELGDPAGGTDVERSRSTARRTRSARRTTPGRGCARRCGRPTPSVRHRSPRGYGRAPRSSTRTARRSSTTARRSGASIRAGSGARWAWRACSRSPTRIRCRSPASPPARVPAPAGPRRRSCPRWAGGTPPSAGCRGSSHRVP